jgi:hypothetical protein
MTYCSDYSESGKNFNRRTQTEPWDKEETGNGESVVPVKALKADLPQHGHFQAVSQGYAE